jgi:hypothetical protein
MKNILANGGPMGQPQEPTQDQLTQFNAGGSHLENPNGGVPQGMNPNGQQNMVEEGETKFNAKNYIYSDTLKVNKDTVKEFYFPSKYVGKTFAEVSKLMDKPNSRRQFDTIEENDKERDLKALMTAQESFKQKDLMNDMNRMMLKHPEAMSAMMNPAPQMSPEQMMSPEQGQVPPVDPNTPIESPMAKYGGYQNHYKLGGGLLSDKLMDVADTGMHLAKNFGTGVADIALSAVGADNVIKDSDYSGAGSELAKGYSNVAGGIAKVALPMAANILIPGSGAAVKGVQQVAGNMNPEDPDNTNNTGDQLGQVAQLGMGMLDTTNAKYGGHLNMMYGGGGLDVSSVNAYAKTLNQPTIPISTGIGDYASASNINVPQPLTGFEGTSVPQFNVNDFAGSMSNIPPVEDTSDEEYTDPTTRSVSTGTDPNPTHTDDTDGGGAIGANETKQTALNAIGTYAPAAYNIGMGLFGKVDKLSADDYVNKTQLNNYRTNINPQLKASDEAFASAQKGVRNAGAGGGAYLASLQALHNNQAQTKAQIYANAENDYLARQLQIDQVNAARGDQNAAMRLQIHNYNMAAKNAKTKTLQEGIGQVGQIAQSDTQNKLAAQANRLYAPTYTDQGIYTPYAPEWMRKK